MKYTRLLISAAMLLLFAGSGVMGISWTQDLVPSSPFSSGQLPGSMNDTDETYFYTPPQEQEMVFDDTQAYSNNMLQARRYYTDMYQQPDLAYGNGFQPMRVAVPQNPTAVPEPSGLLILGTGLGTLGLAIKYRKYRKP